MINLIEIQFWKIAKWIIRRGWGANCKTIDYEDYYADEPYDVSHELNGRGRCGSCRAKEVIDWIDMNIELLK